MYKRGLMKLRIQNKFFKFRYSLIVITALSFLLIISYQNCTDMNLVHPNTIFKADCLDSNKELTIVDTQNTNTNGTLEPDVTLSFAVYQKDVDGTLIPFKPEDPETSWPPLWFKNEIEAISSELFPDPVTRVEDVIFKTNLNDSSCSENNIQAKLNVCGNEMTLDRNFYVGSCPRNCVDSASGITAEIGDIRDFFLQSTAACGETCKSIQRECLANGTFGPAIGTIPTGTVQGDYITPSCQQASCPTPTPSPTPSDAACIPALEVPVTTEWNDFFGPTPWPSFGKKTRLNIPRETTLSIRFTTRGPGQNPSFGSMDTTSAYPDSGDGVLLMSITRKKGCIDSTILDPRCITVAPGNSIGWEMVSTGFSCPLETNTEYFLNLSYGSNATYVPGEPFCDPSRTQCGFDIVGLQQ